MKEVYKIGLVSIVMPTYNEAENIVDLIKAIDRQVKQKKEFIVVDDNSPDGTSKLVKDFIKKSGKKYVRVETRYKDPGLANSIKRGIELSKGDVIVWLDCDFSMQPELIPKLLSRIEAGYDIAVGSRFIKGGGFILEDSKGRRDSLLQIYLSRIMNYSIQILLGRSFRDYTSGFIAIRKYVFKNVTFRGDYGEYFIELIYKARAFRFKIVEIPHVNPPRERGVSKTGQNIWQYIKRGRKYVFLTVQLKIEKHILHKFP